MKLLALSSKRKVMSTFKTNWNEPELTVFIILQIAVSHLTKQTMLSLSLKKTAGTDHCRNYYRADYSLYPTGTSTGTREQRTRTQPAELCTRAVLHAVPPPLPSAARQPIPPALPAPASAGGPHTATCFSDRLWRPQWRHQPRQADRYNPLLISYCITKFKYLMCAGEHPWTGV